MDSGGDAPNNSKVMPWADALSLFASSILDGTYDAVGDVVPLLCQRIGQRDAQAVVFDGMHPANAQQVEGVRCGGQGEGVIGNRQIQGNVNLRLWKPRSDFVPFLPVLACQVMRS